MYTAQKKTKPDIKPNTKKTSKSSIPIQTKKQFTIDFIKQNQPNIFQNSSYEKVEDSPIQYKKNLKDFKNDQKKFDNYCRLFDIIQNNIINKISRDMPNIEVNPHKNKVDLWRKVVFSFRNNDSNIDTIIGKSFSDTTGADIQRAMQLYQICDKLIEDEIIRDLFITIGQTLSDIFYWSCIENAEVTEICLTDSDVHARGIGVCIVTFKGGKKLVIKPEDKSLEAAIYGKTNSLAQDFNILKYRIPNPMRIPNGGGIGMLDIRPTQDHGSAVEFFEHDDITKSEKKAFKSLVDNETYLQSIKDIIAFASLLGLRDLHHENLVYSKKPFFSKRKMQLIDAEIALDKSLNPSNPLATAWKTEVQGAKNTFADNINPFKDTRFDRNELRGKDGIPFPITEYQNDIDCFTFLEKTREKFRGKKSRIVFISTGDLYSIRVATYLGNFNTQTVIPGTNKPLFDSIEESNAFKELEIMCNKKLTLLRDPRIIQKTEQDFKKGRIPFWEYDFDQGKIYQKFSGGEIELVSDEALKLDNIINKRKAILNPFHTQLMYFHTMSLEENEGYL